MKKFLKFILVGSSIVTPGLCSASTSIMLNVYDDLLEIFSHLFKFKCLKKNFLNIIGILIGILIGIFVLSYLYNIFPFILNIIFLGFIIRDFPYKFSQNKSINKNKTFKYILFIIGLLIILLLNMINKNNFFINYDDINIISILLIIINGLFSSLAMILPGVSGALILVVLGIYFPLIDSVKLLLKYLIELKFESILSLYLPILFIISFILGIIISSKIVKVLLNKRGEYFEYFINGLIVGSIINIIISLIFLEFYLYERIIGIIIFLIIILCKNR